MFLHRSALYLGTQLPKLIPITLEVSIRGPALLDLALGLNLVPLAKVQPETAITDG
ncbi:hypothetical protein [Bryobacter aggregatus]|uniref:hypothetical protein n=1 Tax=Bryobacter aggregatus TaxID=360054 RepID=UPI0012BA6C1C|nr:hypothetical protein [Bryobacter aggregatus]